jgi:arylsulfatase A-like enzyme
MRYLLATAALMLLGVCCAPGGGRPPNVVIIVIDCLRADNLSCYGYHRETSKHIDSLASEGTRWTACVSQAPWTLPAFASILTGTSARSHGAGRRHGNEYRLPGNAPYLPDLFRRGGYSTYGHLNVSFIDEGHGFMRGFHSFRCENAGDADADEVVDRFTGWADSLGGEEPFFALLHLYDPHQHYAPPAPWDTLFGPDPEVDRHSWEVDELGRPLDTENREHYLALYDGEIAFADAELGRLFGYLRRRGLAGSTVVVVMADHGEEFLEHGGVDHGHTFYQELLNVPLIISGPGVPRSEVDSSWTGSYDLAPGLLRLAGLGVPEVMEGQDLFGEPEGIRTIPSSGLITAPQNLPRPWRCSILRDGMKTYRLKDEGGVEDLITDLDRDPMERNLVEGGDSARVDAYMTSPRLWEPVRAECGDSDRQRLRDIGYF